MGYTARPRPFRWCAGKDGRGCGRPACLNPDGKRCTYHGGWNVERGVRRKIRTARDDALGSVHRMIPDPARPRASAERVVSSWPATQGFAKARPTGRRWMAAFWVPGPDRLDR